MVRTKRGFIDPNIGFIGQLMDFEQKLRVANNTPKVLQQNSPRLYAFTIQKERIISRPLLANFNMQNE